MIKNYKPEIIIALAIISGVTAFSFLYGILLPFFIGLGLAFAGGRIVAKMQRRVKNRTIATTLFLLALSGIAILLVILLTQYINRDFKRLSRSFTVLVSENQHKLDETALVVKEYARTYLDIEQIEKTIKASTDSLGMELRNTDVDQLDIEAIKASVEQVFTLFKSEGHLDENKAGGFSLTLIFFSSLLYFVLVLYNFEYFEEVKKRYFSGTLQAKAGAIMKDFNRSFTQYFRLRFKIILILAVLYLLAFTILDMPGTLLITVLIILLSLVPYLQYLSLIPLSLGCLVLSIENDVGFMIYFGIVVGVFVIATIVEELVLTPRIMERNIGMNPVIMILALSIWGYLLGLPGLVIGIPLTSLILIYFKRYVITSVQEVLKEE